VDSTTFIPIFDLIHEGFRPATYLQNIIWVALTVLGVAVVTRLTSMRSVKRWSTLAALAVGGGLLGVFVLNLCIRYMEFARLRNAVRNGRYSVVVGDVTDFRSGDTHRPETFVVDGHSYSYSSSWSSVAFNRDSASGGPIRQGLRLRITDVGGAIVKLEVAE
jgi:hypothetical protein